MDQQSPTVDVWIWTLVAVGVLVIRVYPAFAPALNQDSFQYLVAAKTALAGHLGYTSLIHFDVERSFGTMPAPLLTFPLGYPIAIALVSLTGVSVEAAALILSAASTAACVPLIAWIGARMGFSRAIRNAVIAGFVFNGIVSEFGTAAMTEALFTFLVMLGVAAQIKGRLLDGRQGLWFFLATGLAFGLSYFVRYAGLFFIAALGLLAVRHAFARNLELAKRHAAALAVACLFVAVGIVRNMLIVGNWRGRDEMLAQNPLLPALRQTADALNALFLGIGTGTSSLGGTHVPKLALCVFLALGLGSLLWSRRPASTVSGGSDRLPNAIGIDLVIFAGTFAAGMLYAGLTSEISYGTSRTFVPLVPLIVLLFGLLLRNLLAGRSADSLLPRLSIGALALSFCCYAYLNLLVMNKPLIDQTAVVVERLDGPENGSPSPRAAILSHVGPHDVILANNGQAVGYVLGRPTVSMVGNLFGGMEWNETVVRDTIKRFHIAAIVISPPVPGNPVQDELPSPFIRQLASGNAPSWLKIEYRSPAAIVYAPVPPAL